MADNKTKDAPLPTYDLSTGSGYDAVKAGLNKELQNLGAQSSAARGAIMSDGKPMQHPGISNDHKSPF